jgi:hypothetical protein
MPTNSNLEDLVFGRKRPDVTLLARGQIDPSWFSEYETSLDIELQASTGSSWPRRLVQASHWVSFYLPLRVRVASRAINENIALCKQVFDLHIMTEQKLLTNLTDFVDESIGEDLRSEQPLARPEREIIRLSLGRGNPASAISDSLDIKKWKEAFEVQWKPVALELQRDSHWNKWMVTAIRFASFYWDLLFAQNIRLSESLGVDIPSLKSVLPTPTLAMIHTLLHPPSQAIDESGLPIIGSPGEFKHLSVRRLVEPILMARLDASTSPQPF